MIYGNLDREADGQGAAMTMAMMEKNMLQQE